MDRFRPGTILLLGFGLLGINVVWGVYNAFVPPALAERFGLAPWAIGFCMALDNMVALLVQPPIGAWSDRLRTRFGRRMPFILAGAPVAALAFGLLPLAPVLPAFLFCTSALLLGMALWRTPVIALMPDLTPSAYRSQANGIINLMGGCGAILAALAGGALFEIDPRWPFWLGSGLVLVAALLVVLCVREPAAVESDEAPSLLGSLGELLRDPDRSGLRILGAIFFWFLAYTGIEAFLTLYATGPLALTQADGARLMGHMGLLFVLSAPVAGWLGGRCGRRRTIAGGLGLLAAAILPLGLAAPEWLTVDLAHVPVLGTIRIANLFLMASGIAWALVNINALPMVVDLTTQARVGTFIGLYYLFSTCAAILGPILSGWIAHHLGCGAILWINPLFWGIAFGLILGARRGEAVAGGADRPVTSAAGDTRPDSCA